MTEKPKRKTRKKGTTDKLVAIGQAAVDAEKAAIVSDLTCENYLVHTDLTDKFNNLVLYYIEEENHD